MDVAFIRWPGEKEKRASMLASQQPHLLLVESGPPPVDVTLIEDWIRIPAPAVDIEARLELLRRRSIPAQPSRLTPFLGADGILRFGDDWVSLSPLEVRLVSALLARPDAVVTRQALIDSGWPQVGEGRPNPRRNTLDAHMVRLRQRLPAVGLTVRTIRSRGYMLEQLAASL
ncbi:MAG TPA: helix-turn-helix domain-containing protein [Acidimicrobiia bacterium]